MLPRQAADAVAAQEAEGGAGDGPPRFAAFGFGSNSVRQLRGRLQDYTLVGFPARVRDQALAFAGPNKTWAHDEGASEGGVATLIPLQGEVALGTVAYLTEEQLRTLDRFEGVPHVYQRREFEAEVLRGGEWQERNVVAYVKTDARRFYHPSEAYCCAVLRNLRGSFPSLHTLLVRDSSGRVRGQWQHPGFAQLGLGAFLFEVGVRKPVPWQLPRRIGEARSDLAVAGVRGSARELHAALEVARRAPELPLDEDELEIARLLLTLAGAGPELPDDGHADDAQGERAPP